MTTWGLGGSVVSTARRMSVRRWYPECTHFEFILVTQTSRRPSSQSSEYWNWENMRAALDCELTMKSPYRTTVSCQIVFHHFMISFRPHATMSSPQSTWCTTTAYQNGILPTISYFIGVTSQLLSTLLNDQFSFDVCPFNQSNALRAQAKRNNVIFHRLLMRSLSTIELFRCATRNRWMQMPTANGEKGHWSRFHRSIGSTSG